MRPWEFTGDKSPYNLKPDEKYKSIPELGWYATLNFQNSYSFTLLKLFMSDWDRGLYVS